MSGTDHRQSLRLIRHLPCALRVKPISHASASNTAPEQLALERLESLANEFEGYCEQIGDRATVNALRTLQRQVDHLQSALTTNLVQQAPWTQAQQTRRLSLSFDGLEIELLPSDNLHERPTSLEVLVTLPGLPAIFCTLQVTGFNSQSVAGPFAQISDADLRRLRRYVLVQEAASKLRSN